MPRWSQWSSPAPSGGVWLVQFINDPYGIFSDINKRLVTFWILVRTVTSLCCHICFSCCSDAPTSLCSSQLGSWDTSRLLDFLFRSSASQAVLVAAFLLVFPFFYVNPPLSYSFRIAVSGTGTTPPGTTAKASEVQSSATSRGGTLCSLHMSWTIDI